jgi:hypothetical protein
MSGRESQPAAPKVRLRWYQYSLRSLFIFVTLCAIACSWFTTEYRRVERRHLAWKRLDSIAFSSQNGKPPWYSRWLYDLVGDEDCANVGFVVLGNQAEVTDEDLEAAGNFEELYQLCAGSKIVSDRGLKSIEVLTRLVWLDLASANITDAGLLHLRGMKQLEYLGLAGTKITDAGLEHLAVLKQLKNLDVADTRVSAEGINKLRRALPNCKIQTENPRALPQLHD